MNNTFFNPHTTTKLKIGFSLTGILILTVSLLALNKYESDLKIGVEFNTLYFAILATLISAIGILLGLVMIFAHLNYKLKINQFLVIMLLGILLGVSIFSNTAKIFLITLVVDALIVFIVVIFFKLYSTITTLIVTSFAYLILVLLISSLISRFYQELQFNVSGLFYIIVTVFLIIYRIIGVKVNRSYITIMGQKNIKEEYTSELLISHMNLIYIAIFILINTTGLIYKTGEYNFFNVLNNCFITALALNQIKWHHFKF
ncbi:hypothetical protein [Paenibacillus lautus]|uniref:hypothetical protein n=1 Tax=Paenibacillus lautus TaxID=1401 RepID=UPI000FDAEB7C|nr:hypothetical protein [Paenibacillus lautus]